MITLIVPFDIKIDSIKFNISITTDETGQTPQYREIVICQLDIWGLKPFLYGNTCKSFLSKSHLPENVLSENLNKRLLLPTPVRSNNDRLQIFSMSIKTVLII